MLLRVAMIASSTIALPAVFAVISRPSRIGTPELISVDSVRQNRATAILRRMLPRTGIFSTIASTTRRPFVGRVVRLEAVAGRADADDQQREELDQVVAERR